MQAIEFKQVAYNYRRVLPSNRSYLASVRSQSSNKDAIADDSKYIHLTLEFHKDKHAVCEQMRMMMKFFVGFNDDDLMYGLYSSMLWNMQMKKYK